MTAQMISEQENTPLSWDQLDIEAANMTQMVVSHDFTGKFKRSAFGHYFNEAFYDQSKGKSRFEDITYVYGFTMLIAFKFKDINFDIDNTMAAYAAQYKEIADLDELTFIFECAFKDAYLTDINRTEDVYIEINRSFNTCTNATSVADVQNIERLNQRLWNSPDYCTNLRERVLYFIFEEDPLVRKNGLAFENVVKDYTGTKQFINDLMLVEEMAKI